MVSPAERHRYLHDPFLRAMGYGFVLWGCINVLLTGTIIARAAGFVLPVYAELSYLGVVLVIGVWAHGKLDGRVGRMVGPASDVPLMRSDIVWGILLLAGSLLTLVLRRTGPFFLIQIIWPMFVGSGYAIWGFHSIRPMAYFGLLIVAAATAAGLVVSVPADASQPSWALVVNYVITMGLLWIPFGLYLQGTYLRIDLRGERAGEREDMAA